jgi:hypothetical protein
LKKSSNIIDACLKGEYRVSKFSDGCKVGFNSFFDLIKNKDFPGTMKDVADKLDKTQSNYPLNNKDKTKKD